MVALEGETVVARERVEIVDPALPRQVFHAAHALADNRKARSLVNRVERDALARAEAVLREAIATIDNVVAAGVPVGTAHVPDDLDRILASHSLMHAAEGELYREALAEAAARCGLDVVRVTRADTDRLRDRTTELGRGLGPPWGRDQKDAAAAAIMAVTS